MEPATINLPLCATVLFNHLYRTTDPLFLNADLLAISLPKNRVIDVSWYPENTQPGAYTITVYRGDWENQERSVQVADIDAAIETVERLAELYSEGLGRQFQQDASDSMLKPT